MQFVSDGSVSIKIAYDRNDNFLGYSEVWINGKSTNCLIKEYCLRACIKIDAFYILFTSEELPLSDHLPWSETTTSDDPLKWVDIHKATIYLFNNKSEMLDQTSIKPVFTEEIYELNPDNDDDYEYYGSYLVSFKLIPPNTVSFIFGGKIWILKLLKEPVPFSRELAQKGRGLLYRPYYPHDIVKRFFAFLTKRRLTSLPKNLKETYFDINVWIK
ncbi:unnamed protein product [Commensalibacter communis]|uniref:Uncharacterized protein n=1 Tax=Commensalibacter communis TaxID=2972786 RepID=A0A9W4TS43_9PROT|nr:hypothetical protein [Commensalibacter communis]CAI3948528.1 unnamed protein product [Commensalibacter communis]CAI3949005.1 unnamed protein product [Commensalibacter communis]CAI3949860.1 unnamed protein product [Commensalibacter communis]CAI3954889.1 unnamed protein product [Commensalibacter communis]CAI3957499.1 unnamed protein product [Commensalibacter communis]